MHFEDVYNLLFKQIIEILIFYVLIIMLNNSNDCLLDDCGWSNYVTSLSCVFYAWWRILKNNLKWASSSSATNQMLGSGFSTSKSVQLCNVTCKMLSTVGHALFLKDLLYDINIRVIKSTLGKSLFLRSVHSTLRDSILIKPSSVCHYVNQRIKTEKITHFSWLDHCIILISISVLFFLQWCSVLKFNSGFNVHFVCLMRYCVVCFFPVWIFSIVHLKIRKIMVLCNKTQYDILGSFDHP